MKKPSDLRLEKFASFMGKYGNDNFPSIELCNEFCRLKRDWWGSNLVVLPSEEINGLWSPRFNVWN